MYTISRSISFDSAHQLPWHEGKCKNLHGHTWRVTAELHFYHLDKNGICWDLKDLKNLLGAIEEFYDHKYLNQVGNPNPTAENLAKKILHQIKGLLPGVVKRRMCGITITLKEGDGGTISYKEALKNGSKLAREES